MDTDKRVRVANMLRMDAVRERQLNENATGLLTSLKNSEWLSVAEELANLSPDDFQKIMYTFHLYRDSKLMEDHHQDPEAALPERGSRRNERPPGVDDVFEAHLQGAIEKAGLNDDDEEQVTRSARVLYYGPVHCRRLFSSDSGPSDAKRADAPGPFGRGRASAFALTVALPNQRFALTQVEEYLAAYPAAMDRYREPW